VGAAAPCAIGPAPPTTPCTKGTAVTTPSAMGSGTPPAPGTMGPAASAGQTAPNRSTVATQAAKTLPVPAANIRGSSNRIRNSPLVRRALTGRTWCAVDGDGSSGPGGPGPLRPLSGARAFFIYYSGNGSWGEIMPRRRAVAGPAEEGALLWEPTRDGRARANITRYLAWLGGTRGLKFGSYDELWRWSVTDLEGFWASIWEFFGVAATRPYTRVLAERRTMDARWCPGAELNYAEHALRRRDAHPAVVSKSEGRALSVLTYAELYSRTAAVAAALRQIDRKSVV